MSALAEAWDRRIEALLARVPERGAAVVRWLRGPSRRLLRLGAALLFVLGGVFSFLPILGIWMLPLGLALLAEDLPGLKGPLERCARFCEGVYRRLVKRGGR